MKTLTKILLSLILLLTTTACRKCYLRLQTDYIGRESLASYYVGTPDPQIYCPPIGQRLIVSWTFPSRWVTRDNAYIALRIRFRDYTEKCITIRPAHGYGLYTYSIIDDDYFSKGGILTYKADLIKDDVVVDEWIHQLWVELITIDHPEDTDCQ